MIEIDGFKGLRNDVALERFSSGDLAEAINVELDETGKIMRRLGVKRLQAGSFHSLWGDERDAFVVKAGSLHRVNRDLSLTDLAVPVAGRMVYQRIGDIVYCSDGVTAGALSRDGYRRWGIEPPPAPTVVASSGALRAGNYLFAMTYTDVNGRESGASTLGSIRVGDYASLEFTLPVSSDPQVKHKRIYVSTPNGELPYLVASLTNSDTFVSLKALPSQYTIPLRTLRMGPAPAGDVLGYYNGRSYASKNNYLWYSLPYEYELFSRVEGFLGFPSTVRTFAPVSDGIFVGSDKDIVFLQGGSPEQFTRRVVADYGSIQGTVTYVPGHLIGQDGVQGLVPMWMSKKGVVVGLDGGNFKNLTGGRYILPDGVSSGASLLKVRGGTPQLVTSLFS